MTEKELQIYLLKRFPCEDASCDWKEMKNLKNSFSGDEKKDVISYLSGISNMEGGHLVIGVVDGTLNIVGTDLSKFGFDKTSIIYKMIELCPNLPSEGLFVEEFITSDTNKTVWIVNIPKHLPRRPVFAHRKKWQRIGDSLVELTEERENTILNEEIFYHDWSAEIVEEASIEDLDKNALKMALVGYCERFPKRAREARDWPVEKFLDKAKITQNGKITKTALLLLGKEDAVHYLNHPAELVWQLQSSQERAAQIFYPPFLISATELRSKIRNYEIKIFPSNTLLPSPVPKYDQRSLLEALHNCIMHQDYTRRERVLVIETPDSVTFQNAGAFYDGNYFDYIEGNKIPTKYRNDFLKTAMLNLNMVDSQGFGIHEMYENQRNRYLPLPDYETSSDSHVRLVIPGQVINQEYSTMLMENSQLELSTVFLLDRVQKKQSISMDARRLLRDLELIEGRYPNIIISKRVARITDQEAEYTSLKGFDDAYYKDLILKALYDHGRLTRATINKLLLSKLPDILDRKQKKNKIDYILKTMRKAGRIKAVEKRCWEICPEI